MSPSIVDSDVFGTLGYLCWSPGGGGGAVGKNYDSTVTIRVHLCFGSLMRPVDPSVAPFSLSKRMFPPAGKNLPSCSARSHTRTRLPVPARSHTEGGEWAAQLCHSILPIPHML